MKTYGYCRVSTAEQNELIIRTTLGQLILGLYRPTPSILFPIPKKLFFIYDAVIYWF